MIDRLLLTKAEKALDFCRERGVLIVTAESCTGGLLAASLTHFAGASDVFERGFITYSNNSKCEQLGVPIDLITQQGAVSGAVACAMAAGALNASTADIALSITGVAGPAGGTADKPVGTVHIAKAIKSADGINTTHLPCDFGAQERHIIQSLSAQTALEMIVQDDAGMLA